MVCAAIKDNDAAVQRQRIIYSRLQKFFKVEKFAVMDNWTDGALNMSTRDERRAVQLERTQGGPDRSRDSSNFAKESLVLR